MHNVGGAGNARYFGLVPDLTWAREYIRKKAISCTAINRYRIGLVSAKSDHYIRLSNGEKMLSIKVRLMAGGLVVGLLPWIGYIVGLAGCTRENFKDYDG